MTITVLDTKDPFLGDGSTVAFSFNFKVDSAADVLVFLTAIDGTETVLASPADYTIVLNLNQNTNPGGVATLVAAPGVGVPGVIMRGVDFVRATQFSTSVPPAVIEQELDRLTQYAQQLGEKLDRSLHVSAATQEVADLNFKNIQARAGAVAGFNDQGQAALYTFEGGSIVGPPGPMSASRVEFSAPGIFRRESNNVWSHSSVVLTFIWTVDGAEVLNRQITVTIDTATGLFNAASGANFTVTGSGTQLMTVSSTYNGQTEYAQLAITTMPIDDYPVDTFTPTWHSGDFGTPPAGTISYTLRVKTVTIFVTAARTATSSSTTMTWDAGSLPAGIRPAAQREVQCILKYNNTVEAAGTAFINADGSVSFFMNVVSGSQVLANGAMQSGESKGLPAHWSVVFSL